ncbi:MAG: hypothetical protein ACO37W_01305 [Prochlorotrichaceae cyanobacterium]
MFQEPLTAEFALTQLRDLCEATDNEDEDFDHMGEIEKFITLVSRSEWQSPKEFFNFYKSVGYELFTTASGSEEGEANLFGVQVNVYHWIHTKEGFFALYERAYKFIEQDNENKQYAWEKVPVPQTWYSNSGEIDRLIDLIPATAAYTWDSAYYATWGDNGYNQLQTQFFCDIVLFFGNAYVDSGLEHVAALQIAQHSTKVEILDSLFEPIGRTWYDLEFLENVCINPVTSSALIQAISLAIIGNFDQLESEYSHIYETDALQEAVQDSDDDEKTSLCEKILEHANCTDDIREAIEDYLAKQED